MDIERGKRYRDKLSLVEERHQDVRGWTSDVSAQEFDEDKKLHLATYKAFQEMVEASMDVVAMLVRDSQLLVKDDYVNIDLLRERHLLSPKVADALKEGNGLRNRLIYRYNHLRSSMALSSMRRLLPMFAAFCQEMESWLKQQL